MELVEMGAGWYDPQIGRWLSPDTIIPDPINPQNFNRYAFVLNNPVKYRDPSGHDVDCGIGESGCRQRVAAEKLRDPETSLDKLNRFVNVLELIGVNTGIWQGVDPINTMLDGINLDKSGGNLIAYGGGTEFLGLYIQSEVTA